MQLASYRQVLALPGVRSLLLVAMLARLPASAMALSLTLHVVLSLDLGYGAAGVVTATLTIGQALGGPLAGWATDRYGLRIVTSVTTVVSVLFFLTAPGLPYPALLAGGFVAGLFSIPVYGATRQSLAALVPEELRRSAYSLDSMSVELTFAVGPALAVALATTVSTRVTLFLIGGTLLVSGVALHLLNPPIRSEKEQTDGEAPRRWWLAPRLLSVLLFTSGAAVVLSGTDVSIVAALEHRGQVAWTGAVIAAWCAWSLLGGFVHGALPRALPLGGLVTLLAVCTVPIGLADTWWALCLALLPAGLLCAPTLAATSEAVSRLVPASVRGTAMGLQGTALTTGLALGAPLAGYVIDRNSSAAWGFATAGVAGGLLAALGLLVWLWSRKGGHRASVPGPQLVTPAPAAGE
ncbi:MAG TPA: MFS transporter [Pseudonocardiaceae bacterium]